MFYEVLSKRIGADAKGNDKEYSERFIVENCMTCAEAEMKVLGFWNGENDVVSVKQSKIREFINNKENDEQGIFLAKLESVFIDEQTGEEKKTKYTIGLFSTSVEEATRLVVEYMKQGVENLRLAAVKNTSFIELLK